MKNKTRKYRIYLIHRLDKHLQLRDDGEGNLYDNAHSASFSIFKSSSFDRRQGSSTTAATRGSGSEVGNIFYEQGLISIN